MLKKRTRIVQIEVVAGGIVQLRLAMEVVDGESVLSTRNHRTVINPGISVDEQLKLVNQSITTDKELNAAPIDKERIPELKAICKAVHTPEVVAAFREQVHQQMVQLSVNIPEDVKRMRAMTRTTDPSKPVRESKKKKTAKKKAKK
jgi:hypothetical protein